MTLQAMLQRTAELASGQERHLPISPCISLYLPISPCISPYLPASPYISLYLPTSPDISRDLPTSPCTLQAHGVARSGVVARSALPLVGDSPVVVVAKLQA